MLSTHINVYKPREVLATAKYFGLVDYAAIAFPRRVTAMREATLRRCVVFHRLNRQSVAACATERSRFREVSGARPVLFHPLLVPCGRLRALASSSLPSVRYYSPSSPARRLFPANLVFTRVRSLAAPSSLTVQMTSSCKSSFSPHPPSLNQILVFRSRSSSRSSLRSAQG